MVVYSDYNFIKLLHYVVQYSSHTHPKRSTSPEVYMHSCTPPGKASGECRTMALSSALLSKHY